MEREPKPGEWWVMCKGMPGKWYVIGKKLDGSWSVETEHGLIGDALLMDFLHPYVEPPKPREVRRWAVALNEETVVLFNDPDNAYAVKRDPAFPVVEVVLAERKDGGE